MPIILKRYTRKQLMHELEIKTYNTFNESIKGIKEDLGECKAGRYTELQVEKICKHLGEPMIYPSNWKEIAI